MDAINSEMTENKRAVPTLRDTAEDEITKLERNGLKV